MHNIGWGGALGFWANSFKGVPGVAKIAGRCPLFSCFIEFFRPLPPSPHPRCASMVMTLKLRISFFNQIQNKIDIQFYVIAIQLIILKNEQTIIMIVKGFEFKKWMISLERENITKPKLSIEEVLFKEIEFRSVERER